MADVVLNHKAAADGLEEFEVVEVDPLDRNKILTEPFTIQGWTKFTFDGRNGAYNDFHWHWYHFTGTDYDASRNKNGIYQSKETTKVGLMGIWWTRRMELRLPHVRRYRFQTPWGCRKSRSVGWMVLIETTGVEGFRLDAVKHIDSFFMSNFIRDMKEKYGDDFYVLVNSGILTRKLI